MKRTPLYDEHVKAGAKIIDFGGWELPVEYAATGILAEHRAVRTAAGLFDVSHMGEITIKGPDAGKLVQMLVTNDIAAAPQGKVVYSPMCYPDGGVVDDLLVYRFAPDDILLVVNASNTDKDYEWIQKCISEIKQDPKLKINADAVNVSDCYAQIAIQGPEAEAILQAVVPDVNLSEIGFFRFINGVKIYTAAKMDKSADMKTDRSADIKADKSADIKTDKCAALISRTGYTGEDGFEIYLAPDKAVGVWSQLLEAGRPKGLVPAGLGSRDTLRFEAALPLYGCEISESITPLEAGLGMFVKLGKEYFIGREALIKQKENGLSRKLAGIAMMDRGVPRGHYEVMADGRIIGHVTTGNYSPTMDRFLGIVLIETGFANEGTIVNVVIRGRELKAEVVRLPFYSKRYKKQGA